MVKETELEEGINQEKGIEIHLEKEIDQEKGIDLEKETSQEKEGDNCIFIIPRFLNNI